MSDSKSTFLVNNWYVAAWSSELPTGEILGRTYLGQAVVLFRDKQGQVVALEDRCCHRQLPLSMGQIENGNLQCGYHGLVFNGEGSCISIPGQEHIPATAHVRSFPVVEQDQLIWIWMGEPCRADESKVTGCFWHNQEKDWAWRSALYTIKCEHLLLVDNLMDLTHVGYVHKSTIGGNQAIHSNAEMEVRREGNKVHCIRWMKNSPPPPTYRSAVEFKGNIDRWQEMTFFPGVIHIYTGGRDAGAEPGIDGGFGLRIFNGITPESKDSTHYFWSAAHCFQVDNPEVTKQVYKQISTAFSEDKAILEAQACNLNHETKHNKQLNIHSDRAGILSRVVYEKLLEEETFVH